MVNSLRHLSVKAASLRNCNASFFTFELLNIIRLSVTP